MGESIDAEKLITEAFPGLSSDSAFRISSPVDPFYNCIAWAFSLYKDRWMQFDTRPRFDGVWYWWPEGIPKSENITSYIGAFQTKQFQLCDSYEKEDGYIKIALYVKRGTDQCTHAARQKRNGVWMSKLGQGQDIEHANPYSLEGDLYGDVKCFMKMIFD
jgi:hypothetical protein